MNKINKSNLNNLKKDELNKAFDIVKSRAKSPEKNPENKQNRDIIYFIKKYSHKYKIDITNVLNLKIVLEKIEDNSKDFYEI